MQGRAPVQGGGTRSVHHRRGIQCTVKLGAARGSGCHGVGVSLPGASGRCAGAPEISVTAGGIFIRQGKTSAKQIKAWSDRLSAAIELAKSLPLKDGVTSVYVVHQQNGGRYTRDGFNSRWAQAKEDAQKQHPHLLFDFTFHDLKAKGVSDLEGSLQDKQQISGHKTITQTARYDRKIKIVPVVGDQ